MYKKINKNRFGVIEYSIDREEDLDDIKIDNVDNTIYAIMNSEGKELIYLYSSYDKKWILINDVQVELNSINEQLDNMAIQLKNFGAIGDGIANDTKALKDAIEYCSTHGLDLLINKGNYLVKETLYIDVERLNISGISSESSIIIDDDFVGDTLLYFYSGDGEWEKRHKRIRTFKNIKIENKGSRKVIGMRTSGETSTDKEGNNERATYKNIVIRGFDVAILYGSHSYGFIFEKMYTPNCTYTIKSEDKQNDAGEISVFRNCFFGDAGHKIDVSHDLMFLNCTFHSMGDADNDAGITVRNGAHLTFNQCHFERIQRQPLGLEYLEPLMRITEQESTVTIQLSKFVVSGGNPIQFKSCMFDNTNGATINFSYNDTQWYFKRVCFDEATLKTNNELGCIFKTNGYGVVNFKGYNPKLKFDGGQVPLLIDINSPIYDYKFSELTSNTNIFTFVNDNGTLTGGSVSNITVTPSIEEKEGCLYNTVCRVNLKNNYYNGQGGYIGVMLNIPQDANAITFLNRFWVENLTSCNFKALSYKFYDEFDNIIPETLVQKYNDGFTFSSVIQNNTIYERRDATQIRKIPKYAKKVFVGLQTVVAGNGSGDVYFDYLIPSFI